MNKIETLTNPDSKLNIAQPKEPIWILRASDPLAPTIIREWARLYIIDGVNNCEDGIELAKKLEVYKDTMRAADEMEQWKKEQLKVESIQGHTQHPILSPSPGPSQAHH